VEEDGQKEALERAIVTRAKDVWDGLRTVGIDAANYNRGKVGVLPTVSVVDDFFLQGKTFTEKKSVDQRTFCSDAVDGVCNDIENKNYEVSNKKRKAFELVASIGNVVQKKKRFKLKQAFSPCGISLNWQQQSIWVGSDAKKGVKNHEGAQIEITVGAKGIKQGKKPRNIEDIIKGSSRLCRWALLKQSLQSLAFIEESQKSELQHIKTATIALRNGEISYQRVKSILATKVTRLCNLILSEIEGLPLYGWVRSYDEGNFLYHCPTLKK